MRKFSLTEARNRHGEAFDLAVTEPVLLTKQSRPSHVVLSAARYEAMTARLESLEDLLLGAAASRALARSPLIGAKEFTAALKRLADDQA